MSRGPSPSPVRNILFIAYHFPPSSAVGGQRMANFAAAIRAFGWIPRVLTIADEDVERIDPGRLKAVEGIATEKVAVRPGTMALLESIWKRFRKASGPAPTRSDAQTAATQAPSAEPASGTASSAGLRRFVLSFMSLPDWERGWCVPAIRRGVAIVRRERIEWIVTSCPPYSVHLIGLAVKRLTGCKWVMDFRDPWMTTGSKRLYPTSAASLAIERWLERQAIHHADLVVFNVDRLRMAYATRYHWVAGDKFVFIPNGVAAPANQTPIEKDPVFTISYTGSLYVGRSPEPVLKAVAALIERGTISRDAIRIKLVGQCDAIGGVATADVVARYGLDSVVDVVAPVPYKAAFDIIRRSHLALILAPNLPYQIPAKVYDYLGAGTRMLAIAEDGATADFLTETAAGTTFAGDDVEGIAAFIADEFGKRSSSGVSASTLARYDVRRLTHDLVDHMTRRETLIALPEVASR